MTQSTDQDRADFEAWLAPEYSREKWHTGEYTDDTVYSMFEAWQASRRAQVVQVPNDVAELVAAAQSLLLDPTSHVKKLQLEALAWGPLAANGIKTEPQK